MTRSELAKWRQLRRATTLRQAVDRAGGLKWTPTLLATVLEELHADDFFDELLGDRARIAPRRSAEAIAIAVALRHSGDQTT